MNDGYHHGNLRAKLIERGRGFIMKQGCEDLSLRALADELGVSHNAPYRHFASRDKLINAIAAEDARHLTEALEAGIKDAGKPSDRIFLLSEAYVFFYLKNPGMFRLVSMLPGQLEQTGKELARLCSFAADSPRFAGLSESEIILAYWSKIHGLTSILISLGSYIPKKELKEKVRLLLKTPV